MSYPTPGEYQEALQFPSIALLDPDLQDAEPETNALGLPRAITGAFAVVFPVRTRTARWALKCFLTDVPDQRRRYRAIGEHLAGLELPYMAEFVYQRRGIRVGGGVYPILKMEWLDGHGLNAFVAKQIGAGRVDAVAALVPMWRRMMAALEAATIAHGDLQHGNILVDADGLRLVDYDTMFVPGLEGRRSPEVGHRNYQHPDRDERDFGPYLDRFSALLIDTALQACALEPTLWERFDTGENLLFRSDDLLDPGSSALFEELRRLEQLAGQVDLLRHACYMEPEDVPPLHEIVQDASGATRDGRAGAAADGARGRLTSLRKRRQASDAASAERRVFGEPTPFERWAMPLLVGGLALATLVGFVASWTAALLIVIIVAASWAGAAVWSYRRIPAVRRIRRLKKEDAYFRSLLAGFRDELRRGDERRREILTSQEDLAARRLEEIRAEALNNRLKHHFIGEISGFEGLTHKVVVRLKASGIRTAVHATPERIQEVKQLSPETRARVVLWRSSLVAEYRDVMPARLSPAEERRLRRHVERRLEEIDRASARLREKMSIQENEHARILERMEESNAPGWREYAAFLFRVR